MRLPALIDACVSDGIVWKRFAESGFVNGRDIGFEKVDCLVDPISFITFRICFDRSDVIIPLLIGFFSLFCDRFGFVEIIRISYC